MINRKKTFLSIIMLTVILLIPSFNVIATEPLYTDDIPYSFPIVPGMTDWMQLQTKQEMLEVCQIPEDKLSNMTTEALLETVLNYPLIVDCYAYDSIEDACTMMSGSFNGFNELFSRNDVTATIIDRYSTADVITTDEFETSTSLEFIEPAIIEYLMVCNEIKNGELTGTDATQFYELCMSKSSERNVSGLYSSRSDVYLTYNAEKSVCRAAGDVWTPINGVVKTPNNSNVPEVYSRSPEFTTSERSSVNASLDNTYPNATRVATATIKYNCHSYAWYQQSIYNSYWINATPYIYITDGSYRAYTGTPYAGVKVLYDDGSHSAVCTGEVQTGGTYVVESKWGKGGLYIHPVDYGPYISTATMYVPN